MLSESLAQANLVPRAFPLREKPWGRGWAQARAFGNVVDKKHMAHPLHSVQSWLTHPYSKVGNYMIHPLVFKHGFLVSS